MAAPVFTPQRTQQSPIKIITDKAYSSPTLAKLDFRYQKVRGRLEGHDFLLDRVGPSCVCVFEGMKCPLRKLHFHAPAEHRIDGPAEDLELHLVHEITEYPDQYPSAYLVVGVLFRTACHAAMHPEPLPLAPWLKQHVEEAHGDGGDISLDPSVYLPNDKAYFRYEGSLTTGDFDELVAWVVLRDVQEISAASPLKLDPEDARLVQPIARRFVLKSF